MKCKDDLMPGWLQHFEAMPPHIKRWLEEHPYEADQLMIDTALKVFRHFPLPEDLREVLINRFEEMQRELMN